jgi:hypothetical protein
MPGLHFFDRGFLAFAMTCGIVDRVREIDGVLTGYVRLASSSRLSSRSISSSAGNSMVLKYLSQNSLSSSLLLPSAISSVLILSFGISSYSRDNASANMFVLPGWCWILNSKRCM